MKVGEIDEYIGTHFRKIVRGTARYLVCSKDVAYDNRGIENKNKDFFYFYVEMHDCDAFKSKTPSPSDCVDFNVGKNIFQGGIFSEVFTFYNSHAC